MIIYNYKIMFFLMSEPSNIFLSAPKLLDVDLSGYNYSAMMLPWELEQLRRFKKQPLTVAETIFPSPMPLDRFYNWNTLTLHQRGRRIAF
jgi:hypothetical protein